MAAQKYLLQYIRRKLTGWSNKFPILMCHKLSLIHLILSKSAFTESALYLTDSINQIKEQVDSS